MMIVFCQGHDVPLGGYLEAAAPGHLDLRALELGHEIAPAIVDGHVKLIAVRVADQDVSFVRDVDAVGERRHGLGSNLPDVPALLVKNDHAVSLIETIVILLPHYIFLFRHFLP